MKLIDKDKIIADIERLKSAAETMLTGKTDLSYWKAQKYLCERFLSFIKTIEVKEVDFEKEKDDYWNKLCDSEFGELLERDAKWFDDIAKHFFELGLNFQTKDMQEALRIEYEKGRADVLRCIDPDEMVADFCSQPLSKTRSLASIYRQGIIDIIKRINRNEETSITSTHSIDDGGVQLPKP